MKLLSVFLCVSLLAGSGQAQTVIAKRTIRSKSIISASDLALEAKTTPGAYSQIDAVDGMEARSILYPGQAVRSADIGPPAVIERNEVVTVYYTSGVLSISTEGRALARAGIGDRIRVMNLASRTTLTGVVTSPGEIRVTQ